jgi:hypothetical protein
VGVGGNSPKAFVDKNSEGLVVVRLCKRARDARFTVGSTFCFSVFCERSIQEVSGAVRYFPEYLACRSDSKPLAQKGGTVYHIYFHDFLDHHENIFREVAGETGVRETRHRRRFGIPVVPQCLASQHKGILFVFEGAPSHVSLATV